MRILTLMCLLLLFSCHQDFNENDSATEVYTSDDGDRLSDTEVDVAIETNQLNKKTTITLTLVAEVRAPEVNGVTLQATNVTIKGENAYISYNVKGDVAKGAADIIKLKKKDIQKGSAEILSTVYFTDRDVHHIYPEGSEVYFALASNGESDNAVIGRIKVKSNKFDVSDTKFVGLASYAATSVYAKGGELYVTTGSDGGVYEFKKKDLTQNSYFPISDARWVDRDGNDVAVLSGGASNGVITMFDKKDMTKSTGTFNVAGVTQAQAKSTIEIVHDKLLVGANEGGVKLLKMSDGSLLGNIAAVTVDGINRDLTVTNAADAISKYVYVSSGEAGVYVYQPSSDFSKKNVNSYTFSELGKINLGTEISVNDIAYSKDFLIVASGIGGVKILTVESDDEEDDDDDDD